jgi:hypothetical protein
MVKERVVKVKQEGDKESVKGMSKEREKQKGIEKKKEVEAPKKRRVDDKEEEELEDGEIEEKEITDLKKKKRKREKDDDVVEVKPIIEEEGDEDSGESSDAEERVRGRRVDDEMDEENEREVSALDELELGAGGIPMPKRMRKNLVKSYVVEEKGQELKLGMTHAMSCFLYKPTPSSFKVKSTGDFLKKYLPGESTFDPFAFTMSEEAREGADVRLKTVNVDFVLAKSPPRCVGEDPALPNVSRMLSRCYNRFLQVARCMEKGDELGAWMAIKDGIFGTAHSMTRVNDSRTVLVTGVDVFTSKAITGGGLIREKVKERLKKEGMKKEMFFREGGGRFDPPGATNQTSNPNASLAGIYAGPMDEDDLLAGSALANTGVGRVETGSKQGPISSEARGSYDRGRSRFVARGYGQSSFNSRDSGFRRISSRGRARGRGDGRGASGRSTQSSWGDSGKNSTEGNDSSI